MDFVSRFTKAKTFKEKVKCFIAKMLRGYVVTPLGRIMLLPSEYNRLAMVTGNKDLVDGKIEKKGQNQMADKEAIVDDLNVAKLMLCNQQMLTPEMRVRIGQAITNAIHALCEEQPSKSCSYYAENGKNPCCTYACEGCTWYV